MKLENVDGVMLLRMEAGKANALGPAFLSAFEEKLEEVERQGARALVFTGSGRHFSSGLDLPELLPLSRGEMETFIGYFSRVVRRLYTLPFPVVAAVNGHAVAGGCVLALQADVRIAADGDTRIGLKEAQLGIGLPALVVESLRFQVPASSLVPVALEGRLFLPREALGMGLVDAVVPPGELVPAAVERARELASVPAEAYAQIKRALREPVLWRLRHVAAPTDHEWVSTWFSEEGRRRVEAIVQELAQRAGAGV